jgi:hypothetical protein
MEDRLWELQSEVHNLSKQLLVVARKIDTVEKAVDLEPLQKTFTVIDDQTGRIVSLENRVDYLSRNLAELEQKFSSQQVMTPTLPDTNLLSHSLWKRMWAVFGHGLLGYIFFLIFWFGVNLLI